MKKIDSIFVFALITLFAATAFVLVFIGAKQYRSVTDTMNENYEERTTASFLAEKIRQNDAADAITVVDLEGVPALTLRTTEGTNSYTTYIYYYENALRELVVTDASVYALSSGQAIMELQGFVPTLVSPSLLRAEITDTNGDTQVLYFTIHCGIGKEEL